MSKEDTVLISARDNKEVTALNIIRPGAFSAVLISQVKICVTNMMNKTSYMFLVLETVLVTGNNFITLRQKPSVLFLGWLISHKCDLKIQ
jgi:hypothetical protein